MRIGIATYNLKSRAFINQLLSLIEYNIYPDFIILHESGKIRKVIRLFRFIRKTLKHYRFHSFYFLIQRLKKGTVPQNKNVINKEENKTVANFLSNVHVYKTGSINDSSTINLLKNFNKCLVICNSGILRKKVIQLKHVIFLNIHTSKLPKYRGMNNIEWALLENNELYVTFHRMDEGMDTGDILYQEKITDPNFSATSIEEYRKFYFTKSYGLLGKAIQLFLNEEIRFQVQTEKDDPIKQYYYMHPLLRKIVATKIGRTKSVPLVNPQAPEE